MQNYKKILLVDDEKAIRISFKRELQRYYDVTTASCYEEAMSFLSNDRFDLIITDLVMPGIDGLELLKSVKTNYPETRVILLTGYGKMGAVIEATRAGADDFLLKPCDIDELLLRINKTIERQDYFSRIKVYENIFSTTVELVALVDKDGIYLEANNAYLRAYGRSKEDLIGYSMSDVVSHELFDRKISPSLNRCFSGTVVQHLDLFRLAGRGIRSMFVSYSPVVRDAATAVTSAIISMTDVTDIIQDSIGLQQNEERLRMVHSVSPNGFMDCDLTTGKIYYCSNWNRLLGYSPKSLQQSGENWQDLLHPDDKASSLKAYQDCLDGLTDTYDSELRLKKADGNWMWFRAQGRVVERDGNGLPLRLIGLLSDIADSKEIQQGFLLSKERLEQNTAKQTEQLASHNAELTEANAALTVLLKKRQQDKQDLEARLSENVIKLVEPLVKRLQRTPLDDTQILLLREIEDKLHNITSAFVTKLTSRHVGLTPMETQVAMHVKQGKATKEIADILCLAPDTINVHRKKIRKKLGLRHKSVNLQTFLTSLSEE
jgi:PAS domain S-box-containing protein